MTLPLEVAQTHATAIKTALVAVERFYGSSTRLAALHRAFADGLAVLAADMGVGPGQIMPDDGTPK